MAERRCRNINWNIADENGVIYPNMRDGVILALLMDIRDELQHLNRTLDCPNFQRIPQYLRDIRRQADPARRRKKRTTTTRNP